MELRPLTRWWVGQYLFGNGCFAEVKHIIDGKLHLWIHNGAWKGVYDLENQTLRMTRDGVFHQLKEPFQEIVKIDENQYWPAVDGQNPPWELEPEALLEALP